MPRRQRSSEDEYGSDGSFSPEDSIFDMDIEASDAETEITEVDPLPNADGQVDVAGLEEFVADLADADADHIDIDTVHSSEYYRRIVEEVDNSDSDAQDYSPGTEILLSGFEDHWQRFCKENEFADPHRQLESISLGILVSTSHGDSTCRGARGAGRSRASRPTVHLARIGRSSVSFTRGP
ncbi:hypothetical protein VDGD_10343 [Verticillium dahliae]|nr:hypothetical protein VDGD_10343 [Verticillium dahliae]